MLTSGTSVQALSVASQYTFGVQPILVILLNFQNNATQPYTVATAQTVTFGDTNNFYAENTYGQTSLDGVVTGWYTIPASNTTCDYGNWATLADQAATNAGIDVSSYGRKIYGFPQTSVCAWWGMGTVGAERPRVHRARWINGSYALRVVGHSSDTTSAFPRIACRTTRRAATAQNRRRSRHHGRDDRPYNAFRRAARLVELRQFSFHQTVTATNNYWVEPLGCRTADRGAQIPQVH
jgi:hypothetical protein